MNNTVDTPGPGAPGPDTPSGPDSSREPDAPLTSHTPNVPNTPDTPDAPASEASHSDTPHAEAPGYSPQWLELREGADAAARAPGLLRPLRAFLADRPPTDLGLVISDLGCGTGSMTRWLAPRLDGPQHWILYDHDPRLLDRAAALAPPTAADGGRVTVSTEQGDIGRLTVDGLAGTSLVTGSALLDVLTADEVEALVDACTGAGCPVLLALSVVGRVEFTPADPLDAELTDAFNAHQRRHRDGRRLLGPDAVTAATEAFERRGATVHTQASPWRLDPSRGAEESVLTEWWLRGWVEAAREQRPDLAPRAETYLRRRLNACAEGELSVVVHHVDLLALPGPAEATTT
ncbi:class I SAM-dependent methyltransferase [Streptomyces sp. NPDC004749]